MHNIARSSLTVVGCGIKFLSHLTVETQTYIKHSDKVLYLVNDSAMQQWIQKANPNAEPLDDLYIKFPLRLQCYRAITQYILTHLQKNQHVCVVLYGHPAVFAQPALDAVIQALQQGHDAKLLPAVSAEDCLFADLLIDPGSCGCQSFEATDLLIHQRKFDPRSHLILWQVGVIGFLGHAKTHDNAQGARLLVKYLSSYYILTHEIILYEATLYPHFKPRIEKLPLQALPQADFSHTTTLYIPPICKATIDKQMLQALNLDLNDLCDSYKE